MQKITIYGWAIPEDRFRGPGSGTLVDLTYFLDDSISVGDILRAINQMGFKLIRDKQGGPNIDRITIEDVTMGIEPVRPEGPQTPADMDDAYRAEQHRYYEGGYYAEDQ